MTFLLFQAFLLMAAAYFLGAFLGCWWRRTFHEPAEVRSVRSSVDAVATVGAAASAGALNVPRSEPIPVQPRIEYVEAPESMSDRNRFERALSGVGSLEHGRDDGSHETLARAGQDVQPLVEDGIAHFDVEPRSTLAEPQPDAPSAPRHAEPPAIVPEPEPAAAKVTDDAVAAAAAAAAAAVARAARQRAFQSPTPPTEVAPAPTPAIPVAASGGMASVAADVRVPPLMPADRQDLKLIRDIDADAERTLNSLGVWRYADIARWGHGDVAAVNNAVGAPARVQRENWIEQASMLAKGGFTAYARRRLRGEAADARPTDTARPSRGPMATAAEHAAQTVPAVPSEPRTPSAMASVAAAAVAAAAASASRGRAASAGSRHLAPVRAPRPVITDIGEPKAAEPQPIAAAAPSPPALVAPEAPAGVVTRTPSDSLQRIRGIDPAAEQLLRDNGVTRYAEIAGWTAIEVEYFDELMEQPGRVSRENWIEQAQILARGGSTLFARQRDGGNVHLAGGAAAMAAAAASAATSATAQQRAPRPSRLADAMRLNQDRTPPATQPRHDQPESQPQPARKEVAGLRSVRSEALRSERFGGPAHVVDDLKRIRGIGVLIEKKLNSLGIASYDQIANWTAADIAHISEVLDFRGRIERENWIEQARILCAGGQTEFSRRVDRNDVS
ncbi:MAG: hypothetical protein AB7U75_11615 [Hyphomicrobiaceae bacterium]